MGRNYNELYGTYGAKEFSKEAAKTLQQAFDLTEQPPLQLYKYYATALLNDSNLSQLEKVLAEYSNAWQQEKDYGHGITIGVLSGGAKLYPFGR